MGLVRSTQSNTMVTIPIKKLTSLAITPTRGSDFAAGYDLYSTEDYTLKPLERKLFKTHLSLAIPHGLYGRIAPRSGLAYKDGIDVMAGVIDEDYRGELGVILINLGQVDKKVSVGDKIAQIIFENYTAAIMTEVPELPDTNRGEGGFGSTDGKVPTSSPAITVTQEPSPTIQTFVDGVPVNSISELYFRSGGVAVKKRYSDEVKERAQQ